MIILDIEQGSEEWFEARLGIPTSSHFHEVITPKTLKPSTQVRGYMYRLLFEQLAGVPHTSESQSAFMARGGEMEAEARKWYEFVHSCDVREVGFVLRDDKSAGCSPDGLVGDDGVLEVKVPSGGQHVAYMHIPTTLVTSYWCQVQGQMWICERQWCDLMSYNPALGAVIERVTRDEPCIEALAAAVAALQANMQAAMPGLMARLNREYERATG